MSYCGTVCVVYQVRGNGRLQQEHSCCSSHSTLAMWAAESEILNEGT